MTTFLEVVEALIASREHCAGSLASDYLRWQHNHATTN